MGVNSIATGNHFVLVHGACCGAWSWHLLVPLLQLFGNVSVLDLAASGKNPKQIDDISSYSDYVEPLMELLADLPSEEKVVLVGHSIGGIAIADAMENFPHKIRLAVFLTAYMPGPTLSPQQINELFNIPEGYSLDTTYTSNSFLFGPIYIARRLYTFSSPEEIALAESMARPYPNYSLEENLTDMNYGSVPRVFIVSGGDNGLRREWQLKMIEKNPPNEVREIANSDHMVMSSEPLLLASHLVDIAGKYV